MIEDAANDKQNAIPPYIQEYFNVKLLHTGTSPANITTLDSAGERMINTLIDAMNGENARLPKYLVIVTDMHHRHHMTGITDMGNDIFDEDANKIIQNYSSGFVHQVNMTIRRKKLDLQNKKPGASVSPKVIFMRMIHKIGYFNEKTATGAQLSLRAKFNALNDDHQLM